MTKEQADFIIWCLDIADSEITFSEEEEQMNQQIREILTEIVTPIEDTDV